MRMQQIYILLGFGAADLLWARGPRRAKAAKIRFLFN